ncbi:N-6 DNA methylase [bacterium]|nr:N-6 DNA methylase [bacterium]
MPRPNDDQKRLRAFFADAGARGVDFPQAAAWLMRKFMTHPCETIDALADGIDRQDVLSIPEAELELGVPGGVPGGDPVRFDNLYDAMLAAAPGHAHDRRARGTVYTPAPLVEYVLDHALAPALERADDPLALRVLDPACGGGRFLLAAARRIADAAIARGVPVDEARARAAECVVGVDTDPLAVIVARLGLVKFASQSRFRVSPTILDADALAPDTIRALADAQIAPGCVGAGPFEVVVGNPPYITHGLRGAATLDAAKSLDLRARFPLSAEYKINIPALFVELALRLVRADGRVGLVLPDSFLTGRYFRRLREELLARGGRVERLAVIDRAFARGDAGRTVVLVASPDDRGTRRVVTIVRAKNVDALGATGAASAKISARAFAALPATRFSPIACDATWRRVTRAFSGAPLSGIVQFRSGLVAKNGRASFVVTPDETRSLTVAVRDRESDAALQCPSRKRSQAVCAGDDADNLVPLIASGRELRAFDVRWAGHFARRDAALYKSGYHARWYESAKLLVNQTGDRPRAAVDASGLWATNNLHVGLAGSDEILHFVAALVNSAPFAALYAAVAGETGRAMAQIDIDLLAAMPLPPGAQNAGGLIAPAYVRDVAAISRELHENPNDAGAAWWRSRIDSILEAAYDAGQGAAAPIIPAAQTAAAEVAT